MWQWIWENISNIDSVVNIITVIFSGGIFVAIRGLIDIFLRLKLKKNQYKYLNMVVDKQTKESMKYYVPTRAQAIDPCDDSCTTDSFIELIPYFINEVFKNADTQYFIILADSGMGKTTFLLKLFFEYYKKLSKKHDIVFVPLSLDSSIERIKGIQNKPNTILLLDGFDEDKYAIDDYNKRLKDICNETELFYKVIMSCRTQFFPDSDSEPRQTDRIRFGVGKKNVEFVKYYISPFNGKEIESYLKNKYNIFFERNKINRAKKMVMKCPQLMVRPMLLAYMDDLIEDKEKEYNYVYEIYNQLVYSWIEREAINNETLYNFSEKVAEYMYSNKTVYIKGSEIQKICEEYEVRLSSFEAKSRSLLNRNANGIYKFAHKSILEFILANKAIDDVQFRKIIMSNAFAGYDMLELFLREMSVHYVKKSLKIDSGKLENGFFEFLQLSKIDLSRMKILNCRFEGCNLSKAVLSDVVFKDTNLIEANLNWANLSRAYLRGADLSKAYLSGANLRGANLSEADLSGANLSEANLSGTILSRANLSGANLSGADLSETYLIGANLSGANLSEANLSGTILIRANLSGANLIRAYLIRANLSGANLSGANLSGANLSGADLSGAYLSRADLSGAYLSEADLSGAIIDEFQVAFFEKENDLYNVRIYFNKTQEIISYSEY